jgi:hypothetical protein
MSVHGRLRCCLRERVPELVVQLHAPYESHQFVGAAQPIVVVQVQSSRRRP